LDDSRGTGISSVTIKKQHFTMCGATTGILFQKSLKNFENESSCTGIHNRFFYLTLSQLNVKRPQEMMANQKNKKLPNLTHIAIVSHLFDTIKYDFAVSAEEKASLLKLQEEMSDEEEQQAGILNINGGNGSGPVVCNDIAAPPSQDMITQANCSAMYFIFNSRADIVNRSSISVIPQHIKDLYAKIYDHLPRLSIQVQRLKDCIKFTIDPLPPVIAKIACSTKFYLKEEKKIGSKQILMMPLNIFHTSALTVIDPTNGKTGYFKNRRYIYDDSVKYLTDRKLIVKDYFDRDASGKDRGTFWKFPLPQTAAGRETPGNLTLAKLHFFDRAIVVPEYMKYQADLQDIIDFHLQNNNIVRTTVNGEDRYAVAAGSTATQQLRAKHASRTQAMTVQSSTTMFFSNPLSDSLPTVLQFALMSESPDCNVPHSFVHPSTTLRIPLSSSNTLPSFIRTTNTTPRKTLTNITNVSTPIRQLAYELCSSLEKRYPLTDNNTVTNMSDTEGLFHDDDYHQNDGGILQLSLQQQQNTVDVEQTTAANQQHGDGSINATDHPVTHDFDMNETVSANDQQNDGIESTVSQRSSDADNAQIRRVKKVILLDKETCVFTRTELASLCNVPSVKDAAVEELVSAEFLAYGD
ncbi:unnamed protein product, partial [Didymodactylos carnosus]